eukprot:TRINITY_DN1566_c0_g1_i2.p1 TRINITY_DN1566_c0_g1~~TRINITY_DN1566_c0_g1_i2.p1  ORF type:complete len:233 (-),score=13.20 TRINITY_DN1566_c0_g1_i2:253-951(-)
MLAPLRVKDVPEELRSFIPQPIQFSSEMRPKSRMTHKSTRSRASPAPSMGSVTERTADSQKRPFTPGSSSSTRKSALRESLPLQLAVLSASQQRPYTAPESSYTSGTLLRSTISGASTMRRTAAIVRDHSLCFTDTVRRYYRSPGPAYDNTRDAIITHRVSSVQIPKEDRRKWLSFSPHGKDSPGPGQHCVLGQTVTMQVPPRAIMPGAARVTSQWCFAAGYSKGGDLLPSV